MTKTIDGATLVKLLKTTSVTERIKNANFLLEALQDESGEHYHTLAVGYSNFLKLRCLEYP